MKIHRRSLLSLLVLIFIVACGTQEEKKDETEKQITKAESNNPVFSKVPVEKTGIQFANVLREDHQLNVLSYEYFHNGGGVAVGDINNDGLPDIYFTANMAPNALYLNKGDFQFNEIARTAGVGGKRGWTTGVSMADVNGDGWLDIYVCRSGNLEPEGRANLLFINNKDLTFSEQSKEYGLNDMGYSTQASFFDYDKDGDLDMYLLNHPIVSPRGVKFDEQVDKRDLYKGDKLYRNDNNHFVEVGEEAGINSNPIGYGLGVATTDLNNDGWPDLYVCNDYLEHDYLYFNNGDGTFREELHNAVKHTSNFSMGVDAADFNNDGWSDIMVADMAAEDNFRSKTNMSGMDIDLFWDAVDRGYHYQYMFNSLQMNNGNQTFSEIGQHTGLAKTDWSWAPLWADFDNDGLKDLFVSNGLRKEARNNDFVKLKKEKLKEMSTYPPNQRLSFLKEILDAMPSQKLKNYIFKNQGDLTFDKTDKNWQLDDPAFSNGAAYADFDLDGDLDLVINNVDDLAFVYRNNTREQGTGHYIRLQLKGNAANPYGIGSKVEVTTSDGKQYYENYTTRGYQSSVEPVIHVGLGNESLVKSIAVHWPDGNYQKLENVKADQQLAIEYSPEGKSSFSNQKADLFEDITKKVGLDYQHQENEYDDFEKELLLPHRMSQFGPAVAVGDVNNDGLEDVYLGGAKGYSGSLYTQNNTGTFTKTSNSTWGDDKNSEDLGAVFFDVDGDQDQDLYVVSGGNEYDENDPALQDRLYLNQGNGQFKKASNALPNMPTSGSVVVPGDIDGDGDLDLFVGGRVIPGKYPFAPRSYVLLNEEGKFKDATNEIAPELMKPGLVTDARWTDYNGDGALDLFVVGEWMPLMILENKEGKLANVASQNGLNDTEGWWFSVAETDIDQDGDPDYIVGNLGQNYKYHASKEAPFDIYCHDFDENGSLDIVLGYRSGGSIFPVRGRECSSDQMPFVKEEFPDYESFGNASLIDIYNDHNLADALHYQAKTFASSIIRNLGNGQFSIEELPSEAQLSPVNGIVPTDVDQDGSTDLILAGNLYTSEVETPRADAGMGLVLMGNGEKETEFQAKRGMSTNFWADGDVKQLRSIKLADGSQGVLVVRNNDSVMLYKLAQDKSLSLVD